MLFANSMSLVILIFVLPAAIFAEANPWTFNASNDKHQFGYHVIGKSLTAVEITKQEFLAHLTAIENRPHSPRSKADMSRILRRVERFCEHLRQIDPPPAGHCPYFFDSFTCWRPTYVGAVETKVCPVYLTGEKPENTTTTISMHCSVGLYVHHGFYSKWQEVSTKNKTVLSLQYEECFKNKTNKVVTRILAYDIAHGKFGV